jgi:hypothetical protein
MVYFQSKNNDFGKFGLAKEDSGLVNGHLVYFPDICYILWHFGIYCGH